MPRPERYPIFPGPGVLISDDDETPVQAVQKLLQRNSLITAVLPTGAEMIIATHWPSISFDDKTGRLGFISSQGIEYNVRELRENDGVWLSKYKTALPIEALERLVTTVDGNLDTLDLDESLEAFSLDDSAYIVALVYRNDSGAYNRINGDWVLMSNESSAFDDMETTVIDPDRAQEFIDLYDRSYVTVSDADNYADTDDNGDSE